MGTAAFSCSVTYTPGGGGNISQSFGSAVPYTAISAGKFDVATGSTTAIGIPFGGVGTDSRGILVQNNTDVDLEVDISNTSTAQYRLAPGGLFMHWAPKKAGGMNLVAITVKPATGPTEPGVVDFIVLGE
jgi:hypothetical protein